MEITITLPDTLTVTARKDAVSVVVDLAKMNAEIVAKAVLHGLKQKIADGAANAKMNACLAVTGNKKEGEADAAFTERLAKAAKEVSFADVDAEALRLMEKVRDTLEAGAWGVERAEGAAELDLRPIAYAMTVYTAKLRADIPGFADLKSVAEKRRAVNVWLDAKAGRREAILAKVAEEAALDI